MEKLWQSTDPAQTRALANIARFFALLLVLTLLARGLTGAVMPTVTVAQPVSGSVTKSIRAAGTVAAADGRPFAAPAGLLVTAVPVQAGQTVAVGDVLACFDEAEVARAIAEKQAQLDKAELQAAQLRAGSAADGFALDLAQRQLQRAYEESEKVYAEGEEQVRQAEDALEDARAALAAARQATPETADTAAQEQAVAAAEAALEAARQSAQAGSEAALSAAQSMEDARDSARHSYEKEAAALADANALGRADANLLQAQSAALAAELAALQAVQRDGCRLLAPAAGTLLRLDLAAGETSPAVGGLLAGDGATYTLEVELEKSQAELVAAGAVMEVRQGRTEGDAAVTALSAPDEEGRVTATLLLPDGSWKAGAANVQAQVTGGSQGMTVPASAVMQDNGGSYLLAVEQQQTVLGMQNVLVRLAVNVREQGDTTVLVDGALNRETQVVVGSDKPVTAGSRVRIDG